VKVLASLKQKSLLVCLMPVTFFYPAQNHLNQMELYESVFVELLERTFKPWEKGYKDAKVRLSINDSKELR
jgi:hypothetical protein